MTLLNVVEINATDDDFARIGKFFFGDHFKEGGLTSAGFTNKEDKFVGCNVHRNVVKGRTDVATIMFGDMVEQYHADILT